VLVSPDAARDASFGIVAGEHQVAITAAQQGHADAVASLSLRRRSAAPWKQRDPRQHGTLLVKMLRVTNFGDPTFEPTDDELAELMREAFAEVPARRAAALARLRREIAELREQAMARLEPRFDGSK
jgi:hypothetical protein